MRTLGVDPGISGALALWDPDLQALRVWDMPIHNVRVGKSAKNVLSETELADIIRSAEPDRAIVEAVHAMPKQGVSSMFTFGTSYGAIRGVLAALQVPVRYVPPQTWQRRMHVMSSGGKDASRQRVIQLLPRHAHLFARKKDTGRSDATLLALFAEEIEIPA
jgi:crossover junction endodeoxyribonuclease RuvC